MHPIMRFLKKRGIGSHLRADFIAGLTTAILLVPQAMAYATLAGLPPVVGLYASTLPLLVYAALGSSRVMAVGPVALISLMTASALAPFAQESTAELIAIAGALALLVGAIQMTLGLLKLNFLTDLLDKPVLTGFTAAAALLIGFSQVPALLGTERAFVSPALWNGATVIVGVGALLGLILLRRLRRGIPAALVVIVVATLAVIFAGLDARGVAIVGQVPAGLPWPGIPLLDLSIFVKLLPAAIAISLVSYLESFAVARALAAKSGKAIDASREWLGVGAANAASSMVGGYPLAGGFSRSAVNATAGARTRLAGAITALLVMASLALLTPLFTSLPRAALAAIIVVAVSGLLHVQDWKLLAKKGYRPFGVALITFLATLILDIEMGLVIGIGVSFLVRRFFSRETAPLNVSALETKEN